MPASEDEKVVLCLALAGHISPSGYLSTLFAAGTRGVGGFCLIFGMRYRSFDNGTADAHGQ
jgi:hypothetical protein